MKGGQLRIEQGRRPLKMIYRRSAVSLLVLKYCEHPMADAIVGTQPEKVFE
jgi:hypothetical protein